MPGTDRAAAWDAVAGAYDSIAAEYDALVRDEAWIRAVLWRHYAAVFHPGQLVLDASCGTGIDAIFLAGRGVRVVATDVSRGMLRELRVKTRAAGVSGSVLPCLEDSATLASFRAGAFDGLVSGYAGLSTVADLGRFAAAAARVLRPGGRMVVHLLARFSAWEWLDLVRRGKWAEAARLSQVKERALPVGGRPLRHYLHLPREAYRGCFAPHFALRRTYSLGGLHPPAGQRHLPPVVVRGLARLEAALRAHRPVLDWGRSFVLDLEKRADQGARARGNCATAYRAPEPNGSSSWTTKNTSEPSGSVVPSIAFVPRRTTTCGAEMTSPSRLASPPRVSTSPRRDSTRHETS